MARWLFDENMPRSAGRLLTAQGHEVEFVADIAPGTADEHVLAMARDRNRVLVTFDADFGDLIYQQGALPPRAVIYLRMHPISGAGAAALTAEALQADVSGQFIVATPEALRRRALPAPAADDGGS